MTYYVLIGMLSLYTTTTTTLSVCVVISLSVCVSQYTMLTGKPPFLDVGYHELSESTMLTMMQLIKAGSYSRDTPEWQCISDDAKKLIQGIRWLI